MLYFDDAFSALYALYMIKLEDIREFILQDMYGIKPCTIPPIDTLTDVAFEYSIISNILLVMRSQCNIGSFKPIDVSFIQVVVCVGCTRWLLIPWLVVYMFNILLLLGLALGMFVVPVPLIHENMSGTFAYQALRCLGLIPLVFAIIIFYCWVVVRYNKSFKSSGINNNPFPGHCSWNWGRVTSLILLIHAVQ